MRFTRLIVAPLACLVVATAVVACGGGDGQLSAEEYFQRMDEIDKDLDSSGQEILSDRDVSARDGADRFVAITDGAKRKYQDMEPPDDLKEAHDVVIEAVDEFADEMDSAADAAPDGAKLNDLFQDPALVTADGLLAEAFCALQREADERGIQADVGCNLPGGGEQPGPSTAPAETSGAAE